ncbi:hypothetical protein BDW60DRAFT_209402 [Aspergillus nidulans var. acristatus]
MAIENESACFKIWAGNLGALQRGRSSLDARLRDSVVLRAAVLKFLGQLQDSLSKSAEITAGLRLPYKQGGDILPGPDKNFEDGSDGSDSSSDIDTAELAERLDEIKDVIEHLYRLLFKIRDTRYHSLTKKVLLTKEEDPQTGKDLFASYAVFDHRHIQEFLDHLRLCLPLKEFAAKPARGPNHGLFNILEAGDWPLCSDDFLRDRLAKAITNQRRYFVYWRRHALKLSQVTDEQAPPQNFKTLVKPAEPASKAAITPPISDNFKVTSGPKTMVSGTNFSMYNCRLDDQLDTETVISYATTAYDVDGKSPELPPPPPDAAAKSEFVYCHKDLDGQQIENLLDLAETTVADDRQTCLFCYLVGPFNKGLYNHVAYYQEQLATFAISRNIDSQEEADSARVEGIRSAGSLLSVALYFPCGESSLDSDNNEVSVDKVDNPLIKAAEIGDEAVVRLLLENGTKVNTQGTEYGNALQAASFGGYGKVVQMLLDHGADINAQGGEYGNALQAASYGEHEEVVQMLLEMGTDVNAQGGFYGNVLQAASFGGYAKVVQMLLDHGADVNAQGRLYGNALQAASHGDHEKVVQMLIDRGADVHAYSGALDPKSTRASANNMHDLEAVISKVEQALSATPGRYERTGSMDDLEAAISKAEQALSATPEDHPDWAGRLSNLGSMLLRRYERTGKMDDLEAAISKAEQAVWATPEDHLGRPAWLNNLGSLYKLQGKMKEAEEVYQQALAGYKKALGSDHTSTLDTVNNLGNLYSDQGKLKEAEEMYQQALAGKEKALGPDHFNASTVAD